MGFICTIGRFSQNFYERVKEYPLICVSTKACIKCDDCIVIVGRNQSAKIQSARAVIICDEADCEVKRGVQLISCGISLKNTISITSRTAQRIILSLNRSIQTRSSIIEPLEEPIIPWGNEYELMAEFAIRLLLT